MLSVFTWRRRYPNRFPVASSSHHDQGTVRQRAVLICNVRSPAATPLVTAAWFGAWLARYELAQWAHHTRARTRHQPSHSRSPCGVPRAALTPARHCRDCSSQCSAMCSPNRWRDRRTALTVGQKPVRAHCERVPIKLRRKS